MAKRDSTAPVPYDGCLMTIEPGAVRPDLAGGSPGLTHLKPDPADGPPPDPLPAAGATQADGPPGGGQAQVTSVPVPGGTRI